MEAESQAPDAGEAGGPAGPVLNDVVFVPRLPPSKPGATFAGAGGDLSKLRELAQQLSAFRRSKLGELPAEARIAIVTACACGVPRSAVADAFQVSGHTVRNAIDRWETGHSTASRPRTGRPRKLAPDAEAAVVAAVRTSDASLNSLAADFNVSKGTIRRVLAKNKVSTSASAALAAGGSAAFKKTPAKAAAAGGAQQQQRASKQRLQTPQQLQQQTHQHQAHLTPQHHQGQGAEVQTQLPI